MRPVFFGVLRATWLSCCLLSPLYFILLGILLLKFAHQPLLDVAEMSVLQPRQLLQLRWPSRIDVALSSSSADYCTSDQILIRIDKLVILKTQKKKEIYVLFEKIDAPLVLNRTTEVLVACVENPLSQENFNHIEERRRSVHVETNCIEDGCLLSYQLIFLAGEPQIINAHLGPVQRAKPTLVYLIIVVPLSLCWFITRQLT